MQVLVWKLHFQRLTLTTPGFQLKTPPQIGVDERHNCFIGLEETAIWRLLSPTPQEIYSPRNFLILAHESLFFMRKYDWHAESAGALTRWQRPSSDLSWHYLCSFAFWGVLLNQ